jgi:uncharacterized protein YndB with AHSA1/START domain
MLVNPAVNRDSFTVSTPSDQEIRLTRLFDAPRWLVFEAMTKPEHVRQWWGRLGDGYSVPVCEIDLRVGGAWRFVNRHPHGEAAFRGEYLEIVPPSRLTFTEIFEEFPDAVSVVTTDYTEEGRQDTHDGHRPLSVRRSARHGVGHRHGEGRRHQLRPAGRSGGRVAAVVNAAPS